MAQIELDFGSDNTKCSIRTTTKMHEIRLTVRGISKLPLNTKIISPNFHLASNCIANIFFEKTLDDLYVYICNQSDTEIEIERTIVLSDCKNKKLHVEDSEIFSLKKGVDIDVISNVKNRSVYDTLTNDTLIIDICVSIKEIVRDRINRAFCPTDPCRKLIKDLKTMLENPVNSDVCLKVGDERIPAHWSLLCSRSPYFKRMFDSQMKERVQNYITITDLSFSAVKKLIEYLYTADFGENDEDDVEELFDLYYAADKYEVTDLRNLCSNKIISSVTADNVCQIYQLALRHNDKDFKKEAMDFIYLHSGAVFQTEGWRKFEQSEPQAAELMRFFCSKKN